MQTREPFHNRPKVDVLCARAGVPHAARTAVGAEARPVCNFSELLQAFSLIYREYRRERLCPQLPHELVFLPHHLLPTTTTLVARRAASIVGTMTVSSYSPAGLPFEQYYGPALDRSKERGRRCCEVSLITASDSCPHSMLLALIARVLKVCLHNQADDLYVYAEGRLSGLFEQLGIARALPMRNCFIIDFRAVQLGKRQVPAQLIPFMSGQDNLSACFVPLPDHAQVLIPRLPTPWPSLPPLLQEQIAAFHPTALKALRLLKE